jgi:ribokinase
MRDVLVVGSLNLDLVTRVARLPGPGETVLGGDLVHLPGGKGANQALAAAGGAGVTRLVGRVGDEPLGRRYREELARRGVDTGGVLVTAGVPTGRAFIAVADDGENSIVVMPGANARVTASDVDSALGRGPAVLLLQLELPLPVVGPAAVRGAALGCRVLLNASPIQAIPAELVRLADPLIVNRHEAGRLAAREHPGVGPGRRDRAGAGGDAAVGPGEPAEVAVVADRLRALGARSVVVTLGAAGAYVSTVDFSGSVPAPAVTAVDTTGAGNVFAGTLAAELARGTPLADAVGPAVAAASLTTTRLGAQDWRFDA